MKKIILSCRALSPITLRSGRSKDYQRTLHYIPGTIWRGALAQAHNLMRPGNDEELQHFFLNQRVIYGNLLPASFKQEESELQDDVDPVFPLPLTARSCKRSGGFLFQTKPNEKTHGVKDALIPWLLFALSNEVNYEAIAESSKKCPVCKSDMEIFQGYYRRGKRPNVMGKAAEQTVAITRVGINRLTGTAQENILFSREAIPEDSKFWGCALVEDRLAEQWCDFLEETSEAGLLHVGAGRTSGYGKISLRILPSEMEKEESDSRVETGKIHDRCVSFNDTLKKESKKHKTKLTHPFYLPLTLMSDVILQDELLHYYTSLTGEWFNEVAGLKAVLVYQSAKVRRISGWDNILKLPRPDAWGIACGSVFVFALEHEPNYIRLSDLQQEGIGIRRCEGFGKISWADQWHQEVAFI